MLNVAFGLWDWLLIAAVTVMSTALAYMRHPKLKAQVLSLPIPFSIAFMAVGEPIGMANLLGLLFLILYFHGVRAGHVILKIPVSVSIFLAASGYVLAATLLAPVLPADERLFWLTAVGVMAVALLLHWMIPARAEPGHRSPMPVWAKTLVVLCVVVFLVLVKKWLRGFITCYPMVSIIGAYESRHSLMTMCRQMPILVFGTLPMMIAIHVLQPLAGAAVALAAGWTVYLGILTFLARRERARLTSGAEASRGSAPAGIGSNH